MKRAKLEWLINRLQTEVDDDHFDMSHWLSKVSKSVDAVTGETFNFRPGVQYTGEASIPHCQTAGCIAGTVFLGMTPDERAEYHNLYKRESYPVRDIAVHYLGLDYWQARELFEPTGMAYDMSVITRKDAIAVLETILTDGVIDWHRVLGDRSHNPNVVHVDLT